MKRLAKLFLSLILGMLLLTAQLAQVSASQPTGTPTANGRVIRDFARITFEWPRPVYLTAQSRGNELVIEFERPASPDMTQVLTGLGKYIHSYRLDNNGKRLVVTMAAPYRVRSFVSGNISGVDILSIDRPPAAAPVAPPALPPVAKAAPVEKKSPPRQPEPVRAEQSKPAEAESPPVVATVEGTNLLSSLAPAGDAALAPEQAETPAPSADEVVDEAVAEKKYLALDHPVTGEEAAAPESSQTEAVVDAQPFAPLATAPDAPPEKIVETKKAAVEKVEPTPVANPAVNPVVNNEMTDAEAVAAMVAAGTLPGQHAVQPAVPEAKKQAEVPTTPAPKEAAQESPQAEAPAAPEAVAEATPPAASQPFTVQAEFVGDLLQLRFPWAERTAAAAFVRGGYAWIVFNRASTPDLAKVNALLNAATVMEAVPMAGNTVLKLPVNPEAGISAETVSGGFEWQVTIHPAKHIPAATYALEINTEPPLKPHIFLPVLEGADPVTLTDPDIGDKLLVLPTFVGATGISPARHFVDFTVLESGQGVAIQKVADSTHIVALRNGIRVETEEGAHLTPDLPPIEGDSSNAGDAEAGGPNTFFPYEKWKPENPKDFFKEVRALVKQNVENPEAPHVGNYLRLAELYLSEGYVAEAIGYLNMIKRTDPQYFINHKLSAMLGAANFLMQRYSDAAQLFSVPELKDSEELLYWRRMIAELLGTPDQTFDYAANYEPYIRHYPPLFRQRLGIIAADRAIAAKEYNGALKIFDQLSEQQLLGEIADYINYLMGKIAVETEQAADGYKIWNKLINDQSGEFVKVRALFSLLAEEYKRSQISQQEMIDQLERLAIRWRGDNLELGVLSALSDIYEENRDWTNAIRTWRALNEAFPNTVEAVEASRNMNEAFVAIFDKGEATNLSTLDLLFLYNEYRELIPTDEVGDRIVDNVADKMIELDLLPQTAELLEQRMRYRFEHAARSRVGAKLAEVYLMDDKPDKALEALQQSMYGMIPEVLANKRRDLTATALLELKRYDDLEILLQHDDSRKAELLRLQANWQQKQWEEMVARAENILKGRTNPTASLSKTEAEVIVKLAFGYLAEDEPQQLSYLRDYFTPLMKGSKRAALFEFLTRPERRLTPSNFDQVMQSLEDTKTFLDEYNKPVVMAGK